MVGSVFKFGADTTEYNKAVEAMPRKMRQAAQQIEANANSISTGFNKLRNVIGSLGVGFGASAIVGQLLRVMDSLDRVNDLAIRFGTSAESIQRVGEAARISGTDIDTVARAMTKAGVAATEAVSKGGEAAETFKRAGINAKEFEQAGLDRKLIMVAEAFKAANGDAGKQNEILKLIGMRAADLIPLISNLDELKASMAVASVVSDEAVKRISKANDELDKMGLKMQANIFAPAIIGALDLIERLEDVNERAGFLEKSLRLAYALPTGGASLLFGGKTEEERKKAADEEQALRNLQQRGQMPQNVDLNNADVRMAIALELEAMEEKRKAAEEVEAAQKRINSLKEFEDTLNKKSAEAETEKAAAAEKRAKQEAEASQFKQYILELDLKIKEAQADGNAEREASLTALKDWTEAAIKYEGDLDMATRDVNASLKERLRLKEAEIAKQQQSIEAELQYAETMAFGTDEAKSKAEWMKIYNEQMARGATEDQARRAANAGTYKEQTTQSHQSTSGAMPDNLSPSPNFGAAQKKIGENMGRRDTSGYLFGNAQSGDAIRSVELMRGEAAAQKYEAKAAKYEAKGQFDQAYNARVQANRIREDAQRRAKMAEQFREGPSFEDSARTPAEKIEQERRIAQSEKSDSAGQSDPAKLVSDIYKLLTERLPVKVLGA